MDAAPPEHRLLVTAGPTHEPIDEVRYLANRSSGRMGVALATAAADRGWPVTLLLGPSPVSPDAQPTPSSSRPAVHRFRTTAQLQTLLRQHWPRHDILIMAAAVADFRPARAQPGKMPRGQEPWTLLLEPTPDLVAEAAASARPDQRIIGFALEAPDQLMDRAKLKLAAKGLAAIVANPLETMDATEIEATVIFADGRTARPPGGRCLKEAFAVWLLDQI